MSSAKPGGGNGGKDAAVAKAAGLLVLGGVAWSLYKSVKPLVSKPKATPYLIEKGDTLFSIAHRNGVTVEALKTANGYYSDDIYEGDELLIPK